MKALKELFGEVKRLLLFIALIGACLLLIGVGITSVCHANIEQWLPPYPNSTFESETHNFISRGWGFTLLILRSTDDPDTARRYYGTLQRDLDSKRVSHGLARTFFEVQPDGNSGGSVIFLTSQCGS